jgi:hypothetical protein
MRRFPRIFTDKTLVKHWQNRRISGQVVVPLPFVAWHAMAWASEMLPKPPITRNKVEQRDFGGKT